MSVDNDIAELREDLTAVINESMKCKLDVYQKLREFEEDLEVASVDRANYNLMLNQKIDKIADVQAELVKSHIDLQTWFKSHDEKEMEKYQQHTDAINNLTNTLKSINEETIRHSSFIQSEEYNRNLEALVQKRLDDENKPRKEILNKVYMTAIATITVAILTSVYYGIKFVYDLSIQLGG